MLLFFYESQVLHRQLCSGICSFFGDAFGPAYAIFWCFCIQLCSFFGGSNLKKMLSTRNYATLWPFPAFTAVLPVMCAAVQLSSWLLVTVSLLYVLLCVVCVCVRVCWFFFLSFSFNFNFELCACLFAVCDKWVDFRGGDAVQQSNALLMFYV